MVSFKKAQRKLKLELLLMWPFVQLGKLYGRIFPLNQAVDVFFILPNADIGGSPKVNLDIVECIKQEKKCLIIFSKKPKNNLFLERFKSLGVPMIDLHRRIDHKLFHFVNFFYRGVISSWVRAQENPTVFGGECIYLYKIVPHLPKHVRKIELIHLATWIDYSIAFAPYLDVRLFSTLNLERMVQAVYAKAGVPHHFEQRFRFIDNTIDIPANKPVINNQLEVVFVGRGSIQKRPELIAKIAQVLHEKGTPVHFSFVGDVELMFDPKAYPYCTFYGNVKEEKKMLEIYSHSDILMLTSEFEGLPIVVMQMMAYGKIIVSTAVGGIPDYIVDGVNGFLIREEDEAGIVKKGVSVIEQIVENRDLIAQMGKTNKLKAIELFGQATFQKNIKAVFER